MAGRNLNQLFPPKPTFTEDDLTDQSGRVFFITGGVSGIGFELCKILYAANATIYIATRSASKIATAIKELESLYPSSQGRLESLVLDLSDLTTIKPAADSFLAEETRLDVLVHNAGVMMPPKDSRSAQGHELQMGTNALGPFLLTRCLQERLRDTAAMQGVAKGSVRVVWIASMISLGAPKGGVVWNAANDAPKELGDSMGDYMQSKVGVVFLAKEFANKTENDGIISVSVNPGLVKTELQRHAPAAMGKIMSDFTPHNELALLTLICQSLSEFKRHLGPEIARSVEIASVAMQHMLQVHTPLHDAIAIEEQFLHKILSTLPEPESIALYVKQQNAGMLITRARDAFQFETFELSPTNVAVIGTIGRLRRSFPGRGVTVGVARALEPGFLETLVATLAKMSTQAAPGTLPQFPIGSRRISPGRQNLEEYEG
ncbi:hypothetical protein K4K61_011203 [Colletotrichum sp. SAR11_59]|nr:hypothetical protein K4K61_011203 [Colletotrichum sp. SAR11_59]